MAILGHQVPMGIAAGLFFGKPLGVMLCCFLILKFGIAQMPRHVNWGQLFGVSLLCGIGFTMSLFIGSLAFGGMGNPLAGLDRLGIFDWINFIGCGRILRIEGLYPNGHFVFLGRSR